MKQIHIEYLKPNKTLEFYKVNDLTLLVHNYRGYKYSVFLSLIEFLESSPPVAEFYFEQELDLYLNSL